MITFKIWFLGALWTVITKTSLSLPISRSWWIKSVPTKAFTSGVRYICYKGNKIQVCRGNKYYESYVCWGQHKYKFSWAPAVLLCCGHLLLLFLTAIFLLSQELKTVWSQIHRCYWVLQYQLSCHRRLLQFNLA